MKTIEEYAIDLVASGAESFAEDDLNEDGEIADTDHRAACDLAVRITLAIRHHPDVVLELAGTPDQREQLHAGYLVETTAPTDERPYRRLSRGGPETRHVQADGTVVTYRQVGWHGQTGAFYAYDEEPFKHEPGSWSPMWVCVDTDHPDRDVEVGA